MNDWYMKKPCEHCPFRNDVKPFLRPSRGEELASAAYSKYSSFPCHKTTESVETDHGSETVCVNTTKECAGFMTLQAVENGDDILPEGFTPSFDVIYDGVWDMIEAYEESEF